MALPLIPFVITGPNLILCEGGHDKAFFRATLDHIGRSGDFQMAHSGDIVGGRGGNTQWELVLTALTGSPDFHKITGLIIVGDNDKDHAANIRRIKAAIRRTPPFIGPPSRKLHVPRSLMRKSAGVPAVAIVPIPNPKKNGTLETLCIQAAQVSARAVVCADQFIRCNKIHSFGITKRTKIKTRLLIAASHKRNPEITLSRIWEPKARGGNPTLIPIAHVAFHGHSRA
jgi:hypothetical protein